MKVLDWPLLKWFCLKSIGFFRMKWCENSQPPDGLHSTDKVRLQ